MLRKPLGLSAENLARIMDPILPFLRYPGGKRRMLDFLSEHLPSHCDVEDRFIEPFVGGGAIYFYLRPKRAVLSDLNSELITIYKGIKTHPERVWRLYRSFPSGKTGYKAIRMLDSSKLGLAQNAARSLYLNRTCFKGMWRHNLLGKFNVGYGGEARRWAVSRKRLFEISKALKTAVLRVSDFESVINSATTRDFLFLDPPYRPGAKEQINGHYVGKQFTFSDHQRLAKALILADRKGVRWAMTTSAHADIRALFRGFRLVKVPKGTGRSPGIMAASPGEVLILNN
jgi:DNA adenine methylase